MKNLILPFICLFLVIPCSADTITVDDDIWVVDKRYLSSAEGTLALTLQGLVAKERPAIWIRSGGMNAVILKELRQEGTNIHYENSVWRLLRLFRDHVNGAIVYNLSTDSVNVATSLCGPMQAVAVDESILGKAMAEGLSVLLDVRGYNEIDAFTQYKDFFACGILVTQEEGKNEHLRDLAVLRNAFTFYGVGRAWTIEFVSQLGPNPLVFGWEGEHEWVRRVSQGGGAGVPADWSLNLSSLSRLPVEIPRRPWKYPDPMEEGERIVAFVMSDGDNIQWMGGGFVNNTGFWASPYRGTFNMTWEMAPVFVEVAPRVLRHFYNTASEGEAIDDFVTGPSGAGYCYHNYLPDRQAFAEQTASYMRKSNLSIVTVLNSGGDMTQTIELLGQPEVMGVLYKDYYPYNKRQGEIFWHNGKPCISYRYLLWEDFGYDKTPEGVANAIATLPASPLTDQNSYAIINVHAWSFGSIGGPMEAVKRTIDRLPPNARVVTAEELIILLRNNFGSPPYIETPMQFTPQTLNPDSKGKWVKAHFVLPEGFVVEDVDVNTPAALEPLGIESDYINVFINEDGLVEIEVAFGRAEFCGATMDYGPAEVIVIGKLTSGQDFYGTDTIRIITNNLKYLAVLSSYWLETGCGKPDWCGGADLDQNFVVDFIDFALFDGCCIKFGKK